LTVCLDKRPELRNRDMRMDLGEMGWGGVDCISLAQVMNWFEFGIEPTGSMKCWETIEWPNI
jgi:uncharacterized protein YciW